MSTVLGAFSVHATDNLGQEIRGPDGTIIVWTTDGWLAQVIARLLNENEELLRRKENRNVNTTGLRLVR